MHLIMSDNGMIPFKSKHAPWCFLDFTGTDFKPVIQQGQQVTDFIVLSQTQKLAVTPWCRYGAWGAELKSEWLMVQTWLMQHWESQAVVDSLPYLRADLLTLLYHCSVRSSKKQYLSHYVAVVLEVKKPLALEKVQEQGVRTTFFYQKFGQHHRPCDDIRC